MTERERCEKNGWTVGTRLVEDDGSGPTEIEITAIGAENILAREVAHNGIRCRMIERPWNLGVRDWKRVE